MRKFLPYILILIILVGLFSPTGEVQAQTCTVDSDPSNDSCTGICVIYINNVSQGGGGTVNPISKCKSIPARNAIAHFFKTSSEQRVYDENLKKQGVDNNTVTVTPEQQAKADAAAKKSDTTDDLFGLCNASKWTVSGCIVHIFYWIFLVLPSGILYLSAYLFNSMLSLTLGTILYKNNFLPAAWKIIRDFSNIFFILVLLYTAIKMILGIGGAEVKKIIVQVIIMALLINFSMFFTQVVIDSSNILALIFYNKIAVISPDPAKTAVGGTVTTGTEIQTGDTSSKYTSTLNPDVVGVEEKDIAGAIVSGFNPAKFLNAKEIHDKAVTSSAPGLFQSVRDWTPGGTINPFHPVAFIATQARVVLALGDYAASSGGTSTTLPVGIALIIIFTTCLVYLFAAYAFFVAGLAFIGRLIELWMLIIFSPFAFMSLAVPEIKGLDYFGWGSWVNRLLKVAFMAPIFMFFMFIISMLVNIDIFANIQNQKDKIELSIPHLMVILAIPAVIYITLLFKAVHYAKKGAGTFGEAAVKYGSMVAGLAGGLALAGASGGTSLALKNTIGRGASNLTKEGGAFHSLAERSAIGRSVFKRVHGLGDASFDARGIKAGGGLAGIKGLSGVGKAQEGFRKSRADRVKRDKELAEKMDMSDADRAKMTRGGMDGDEANRIGEKMKDGGMEIAKAEALVVKMINSGVSVGESKDIARHVNADTRNKLADSKEGRKIGGFIEYTGDDGGRYRMRDVDHPSYRDDARGKAKTWFRYRNMAANDTRLPAKVAEMNDNIGKWATAMKRAAESGATQPTTPPAGGGGAINPPGPIAP